LIHIRKIKGELTQETALTEIDVLDKAFECLLHFKRAKDVELEM